MTSLRQELENILGHLVRLRRPVVSLLQEPITPQETRVRLQEMQLIPSDEFTELYCWRNGTKAVEGDILDDLDFFPGFYLMSLDDAIQAYRAAVVSEWNPAWFPLFANDCGDFYVVPFSRSATKESEVVCFIRGEPQQKIAFESLFTMARTISACFDAGAYFVAAEGYLEANDGAVAAIARKFNPTLGRYNS